MKIIADMHTHTVASTHAYSTIKEMAEAARDAGLEYLAITDHTPASTDGPHVWHFHNLHKAVPRELFGVRIVYGAESSVSDYEGHLDFPDKECAALDWIIGSVHLDILQSGTLVQNTETYLGLAENPLVDVIGHCAATKFVFDYETGIKAFKEHDKLVEINESTLEKRRGQLQKDHSPVQKIRGKRHCEHRRSFLCFRRSGIAVNEAAGGV